MKRVILSAILLFGILATVSAQASGSKKTPKTITVQKSSKTKHSAKAGTTKTVNLSNRKIYRWSNGQRSTPTGKEATSSNGSGYATIKKDTARVIKKKDQ